MLKGKQNMKQVPKPGRKPVAPQKVKEINSTLKDGPEKGDQFIRVAKQKGVKLKCGGKVEKMKKGGKVKKGKC